MGQARKRGTMEQRVSQALLANEKRYEDAKEAYALQMRDDAETLDIAKQLILQHFKYKDYRGNANVAS